MINANPPASALAKQGESRDQSKKRAGSACARLALVLILGWGDAASALAQTAPGDPLVASPRTESEMDPDLREHFRMASATRSAWGEGNFAALEATAAQAHDLSARGSGGLTLAATFYAQLISGIRYPGITGDEISAKNGCRCAPDPSRYPRMELEWDKVGAKIDKWISLYPRSSTAHIVKAKYFHKKAAFFRGTGYPAQVPPEAWPLFAENLRLEGDALRASYAISKKNPMWYTAASSWLGYANAPLEARMATLAAMKSERMTYAEPFIAAMYFMEPRWGGSLEMMDQVARLADSETASTDFGSTYARVYWGLATGYDVSLRDSFFQKTKADWPKMKKSFEAMVKHFPSSRNYSGYAFFACQAGDAPLARRLLLKAGSVEYFQSQTRGQWPICVPEQWRAK